MSKIENLKNLVKRKIHYLERTRKIINLDYRKIDFLTFLHCRTLHALKRGVKSSYPF